MEKYCLDWKGYSIFWSNLFPYKEIGLLNHKTQADPFKLSIICFHYKYKHKAYVFIKRQQLLEKTFVFPSNSTKRYG